MNILIFRDFFKKISEFKINLFNLKSILFFTQVMWPHVECSIVRLNRDHRSSLKGEVTTREASDHAIKLRSSLKGGATWRISTRRRIFIKMI